MDEEICRKCNYLCRSCDGPSHFHCLSCYSELVMYKYLVYNDYNKLDNGYCSDNCP